jgi:hypothetical protein
MSSSSNHHKRKRSTQLSDFFPTIRRKTHHRKKSSTASSNLGNTSLPTNRSTFSKNTSTRSTIPKGVKTKIWSRHYSKIPHNNKYNPYKMSSAATRTGHTKSTQELKESPNAPKHYYETHFVCPENNRNILGFK